MVKTRLKMLESKQFEFFESWNLIRVGSSDFKWRCLKTNLCRLVTDTMDASADLDAILTATRPEHATELEP